jgi:hypothetical protein
MPLGIGRFVYDDGMANRKKKSQIDAKDPTLSDEAFAAICAVEGLTMSAESKKRLEALRARGLSPDEVRAEILRAYRDR